MKVILQREVDKLGAPGDVVSVADGFARNYLIPRGMAAPASKGAVLHADRLKKAHRDRIQHEIDDAKALAAKLTAEPLRVPARSGEDGRLFGSITLADVVSALQKASGIELDRKSVHLDEPIRSLGTHEVALHLHPDVNATVTIEVVPQ
jgi:large subunit ribosomal protein L9